MLARLVERGDTDLSPIIETLGLGVALLIMPAGKQRFDAPKERNWIVLVGDDLLIAEGPAGFHLRSLRKLMERAARLVRPCLERARPQQISPPRA